MPAIRILIVERHAAVRHGLAAALAAEPGLAVVGEAGGEVALGEVERLLPDVVLLDLGLCERDGGLIGTLLDRSPGSRIVVLSALEGDGAVRDALAAGAHDHVAKDAFREELVAAVRTVGRSGASAPAGDGLHLSDREIEILRLVARGRSNREIAAVLAIAEGTVKTHLNRIFVKMGVGDRTEAAISALKRGAIHL